MTRPRLSLVLLLLASCATAATADIPRPRPDPIPATRPAASAGTGDLKLNLVDGQPTTLRLPRALVARLQRNGNARSELPPDASPSPLHTLMAGLALSAALTLGGLTLVRQRRAGGRVLPSVAILAGAAAAVTLIAAHAYANRPPLTRQKGDGNNVTYGDGKADGAAPQGAAPEGTVRTTVELTDGAFELNITRDDLARLAAAAGAK